VGRSDLTTELADDPVAFVDIETTGGHPAYHRVAEVAVIGARGGQLEFEWSTLVNPGTSMPPSIQRLTGIDNDMLRSAPSFAEIASELDSRLAGRLFIAHNARFDYGFIRREFKNLGRDWRRPVACTVRLSRHLYPDMPRHNLDTLILRHDLAMAGRHRAMPDALALWQLWRKLRAEWPAERFAEAVRAAAYRPVLPPQLSQDLPDELPDAPGVYRFYGAENTLIYVGKADNLRERVLEHFRGATRDTKSQRLAAQTHRVEWRETAGELGALLLEARMVREEQPVYNRRLRGGGERLTWFVGDGEEPPRIVPIDGELVRSGQAFGAYRTEREARKALEALAREHKWCCKLLGFEQGEGSCFGYQVGRCGGVCVGAEPVARHLARVKLVLMRDQVKRWPYPGAVGVTETASDGRQQLHVIEDWQHLATLDQDDSLDSATLADTRRRARSFDIDTYRILTRALRDRRYRVTRLGETSVKPGADDAS
jgi:DNA polymerase III subunit epsilon